MKIETKIDNYQTILSQKLAGLKAEGNYRYFLNIEKSAEKFPFFTFETEDGEVKSAINWCSNDYLGLSTEPRIIEKYAETARKSGVGSGGTRNISGTTIFHKQLEQDIAAFHCRESGLIFNSAFLANVASLSTLGRAFEGCVFISDEKNHASIIEGIKLSGCQKLIFKHNDAADLERVLKKLPKNQSKIIVFESVYSIEGTVAPISEICHLAKKYNALTYCDEVHAVGLYGIYGEGLVAAAGCNAEIDLINGTFAKAFGCIGGYISGEKTLVDFIRSFGKGFIFTTALPPSVCAAVSESLKIVQEKTSILTHFHQNIHELRQILRGFEIPFDDNPSHITRIPIGDSRRCKKITDALLHDFGIYLQPINPPTVPPGEACLRVICSAKHTGRDMIGLAKALKKVL